MRSPALIGCGLVGAIALGSACSPVDAVKPYRELAARVDTSATSTWPMFPVALDDVYRVLASGGGREVEVQRTGGGLWEPGKGAAPAAGSLMSAADPSADPGFGFAGSDLALTVETQTAQRFTIHFGGPNPTGGGYYVRRDGDSHVYVVVDQVFDEVRSLVAGTEITRPDDPRVTKVLADDAKSEDPEEVTNPWLGQVLEGSPGSAAH
jgi:hypothetical protein